MIRRNPFLSERFTAIWSKHFTPSGALFRFDFLPALKFVKHGFLPLFMNVGKTMTKGMSYDFGAYSKEDAHLSKHEDTRESSVHESDYRKKVFLIYDVPAYFEVPSNPPDAPLALLRSRQYPGFLIDVSRFKDGNDYLLATFSKSSRYKLKKYRKRFEASFNISYTMYRGTMERHEYDLVFNTFRQLLEKRFDDKQITNNNLDSHEWQFYQEVTYPMLLENEASLFVIYNEDEPIGVTLNFFSEDILFDAITVFDIDYAKFHLGSITIMALLDWCIANRMRVFDFSKGFFDYKLRWATKAYDFEYHILYDSSSFRARTLAYGLKQFFDLKQRLRDKKVNESLHRMTYRLKNRSPKAFASRGYSFEEMEVPASWDPSPQPEVGQASWDASGAVSSGNGPDASLELSKIDLKHPENHRVKLMVFEYLYLNDGHYRDIKVYQMPHKNDQYYIAGKTKTVLATLE